MLKRVEKEEGKKEEERGEEKTELDNIRSKRSFFHFFSPFFEIVLLNKEIFISCEEKL